MIAAVDVHYDDPQAVAACVLAASWHSERAAYTVIEVIKGVEPYVPGHFYRRELPCTLRVLALCPVSPDIVVIDGFVWLDSHEKRGLGAHLHEALGGTVPIVGVAKSPYPGAGPARQILRGASKKPLFVSAVGMPLAEAAGCVLRMHGSHRLPTLLAKVDRVCRDLVLQLGQSSVPP